MADEKPTEQKPADEPKTNEDMKTFLNNFMKDYEPAMTRFGTFTKPWGDIGKAITGLAIVVAAIGVLLPYLGTIYHVLVWIFWIANPTYFLIRQLKNRWTLLDFNTCGLIAANACIAGFNWILAMRPAGDRTWVDTVDFVVFSISTVYWSVLFFWSSRLLEAQRRRMLQHHFYSLLAAELTSALTISVVANSSC
jgi:hypothetical protein